MWHLIRLRSFQQSQQDRVSRGRILITFSEITQKLTQKKLVENVVTVKIAKRFLCKDGLVSLSIYYNDKAIYLNKSLWKTPPINILFTECAASDVNDEYDDFAHLE